MVQKRRQCKHDQVIELSWPASRSITAVLDEVSGPA